METRSGSTVFRFLSGATAIAVLLASVPIEAATRGPAPRRAASRSARSVPSGEYVLRGPVQVLRATPWNPAGKDRLGTRLIAKVETGADGRPDIVLVHAGSGQGCRFDAMSSGGNLYAILPQEPCRFQALSSPGWLKMTSGWVEGDADHLKFHGTMEVGWLNYRGRITVVAEGGPRRR